MAEKFINYKEVIEIIEKQEKEKKRELIPDKVARPAPGATSTQTVASTPATRKTPGGNTLILDKRYDGDNQSSDAMIKGHQYNPTKESIIQNPRTSQDNRSEHSSSQPKRLQPVSQPGVCSSDSQNGKHRSGNLNSGAVDGMQNRGAEALRNTRRNSSSERSHEKGFTNEQSEKQSDRMNASTFENTKLPYPDGHPKKHCNEATSSNIENAAESSGSRYALSLIIRSNELKSLSNNQNVQSLSLPDGYTLRKAEELDSMNTGLCICTIFNGITQLNLQLLIKLTVK